MPYRTNQKGFEAISSFIKEKMRMGALLHDDQECLNAWAQKAEDSIYSGDPQFEIGQFSTISGWPEVCYLDIEKHFDVDTENCCFNTDTKRWVRNGLVVEDLLGMIEFNIEKGREEDSFCALRDIPAYVEAVYDAWYAGIIPPEVKREVLEELSFDKEKAVKEIEKKICDLLLDSADDFSNEEVIAGCAFWCDFLDHRIETEPTDGRLAEDSSEEEIARLIDELCEDAAKDFVRRFLLDDSLIDEMFSA